MDKRPIEPGLIRIFRYFTGVAMLYFAVLIIYTAIETGEGFTASQIQSYMTFGTNLVLFGYLSWEWLRRRLRYWYLPIGLITATVVPIFSNLIYFQDSLHSRILPYQHFMQELKELREKSEL